MLEIVVLFFEAALQFDGYSGQIVLSEGASVTISLDLAFGNSCMPSLFVVLDLFFGWLYIGIGLIRSNFTV